MYISSKKKNIRIISKARSLEHRKPLFKNLKHQNEIYLHIFYLIRYYFNTLFSTNPISTTIHITLCKRLATRYFNRSSKTPNIPSGISLEYTQSLTTYSSKVQPNSGLKKYFCLLHNNLYFLTEVSCISPSRAVFMPVTMIYEVCKIWQ